jgi:RNA polymerase sigma-70 factor (ECF subfamily)
METPAGSDAAPLDGPHDREVVRRVLAGETGAFARLVERYQDRLYGTVLRLVGCREEARDLVQETFVRAYENLGGFRGNSSVSTWMFRIAVNASLSHRRRKRPVRLEAATADDSRPIAWVDPAAPDPADKLVAAETEARVQQALDEMEEDQRALVVLRDIQRFDYQQLADILGVPIGTVKSRLHRARLTLRDKLRPLLTA